MAKQKKTKDLAQRIDPTYFRDWHRLRRTRYFLSLGVFLVAALWLAFAYARDDQMLYSNGPIAESHRMIEEDCAQCHTEEFGPVYDAACIQCHGATAAHVPPDKGIEPTCAACHTEHKGRLGLDRVDVAHCNACHASHGGITGFDTHLDFKPGPRSQFLAFSHVGHLAPDLVGGALDCGSCHRPQRDQRDFQPIAFSEHCAKCHQERLDAQSEEIVPHGLTVAQLRDWATAATLRRMRAAGEAPPNPPSSVPGRGASRQPEWVASLEQRVGASMKALFREQRGCLLCHISADGAIRPPKIPSNWLPRARFDHKSHAFVGCARCHDMSNSTKATDLNVPTVKTCRECHHDEGARATCITCHPYHPASAGGWR